MDGFLLIDKPDGITSHDVVDRLRRITGIRKIGHGGTLDPFATGLLVVGVGRTATRQLGTISGSIKRYTATARLGATSDTQDRTGKVVETDKASMPTENALREVMASFVGPQLQTPPMFSAKKIGGKKLYELAREGKEIERPAVEIIVHDLELQSFTPPVFVFDARCSSGTYIRTLAHDIGARLELGALLEELRRTEVGSHTIENAVPLESLTPENWQNFLIPADDAGK